MKRILIVAATILFLAPSGHAAQYNHRVVFAQGVPVDADSVVVVATRNDTVIVSLGATFTASTCGTGCYDSLHSLTVTGVYQFQSSIYSAGELQAIDVAYFEVGSGALTVTQDNNLSGLADGSISVNANLNSISNDTAASDNLEDILDGGGSNAGIQLQQFHVVNDTGSKAAVVISNAAASLGSGDGSLIYYWGQTGAQTVHVQSDVGKSVWYDGFTDGMEISGSGGASVIYRAGGAGNPAISLIPGTNAPGMKATTSAGYPIIRGRIDTITVVDTLAWMLTPLFDSLGVLVTIDSVTIDASGIPASVYNYFTSGVREDAFKWAGDGSGPETIAFFTHDTTNGSSPVTGNRISGASFRIYDATMTERANGSYTNPGDAFANLELGRHYIASRSAMNVFPGDSAGFDTITVTGVIATDIFYIQGYPIVALSPIEPGFVRLVIDIGTGFAGISGAMVNPRNIKATFNLVDANGPLTVGDFIVFPTDTSIMVDTTGRIMVDLAANNAITPTTTTRWSVTFKDMSRFGVPLLSGTFVLDSAVTVQRFEDLDFDE